MLCLLVGINSPIGETERKTMNATAIGEVSTQKQIVIGRFNGAFARFQQSCYNDMLLAGFGKEVSHKIASDYASDIGNALRVDGDATLASKIGKAKKDGDSRITISGGGVTKTSRTMSLYRVVQQCDNLYNEGLLATRKVSRDLLSKVLIEYLEVCDAWIEKQTFASE
jgi:hypothetical protein